MKKVKLTDVCDFQGGTQPPKSEWSSEPQAGYVRMLQIRDFTQQHKNYVEFVKDKPTLKKCNSDDILIGRYGASIGKICKGLEGAYNVALIKTIPNKTVLEPSFLSYVLNSTEFQNFIQNIGSRAAQAGFNKDDLSNFEIPLPPLDQQKKIASILDAADAYRQKTKALISKYDELTQSLFLDMFGDPVKNEKGWEVKSGKNVFKLIGGAAFKSKDYTSFGIPLIRIGTVNKGFFDSAQLTFLPYSFEESYSRYIVYPSDLLITLTGTVGKDDYGNAFALTNEYEKYLLNQRVAKICSSVNYNLVFLKFFLKQKKVKNELIGVSRGVRQANLSNEDFYKLEVIEPPLSIQTQFAERVEAIEQQKAKAQESLEKAEELFNSLLQKAFKGELV